MLLHVQREGSALAQRIRTIRERRAEARPSGAERSRPRCLPGSEESCFTSLNMTAAEKILDSVYSAYR